MGKGGSSSSNASTTNVSGQIGNQGDNLGAQISGVNNSTIRVTTTDHGAVNKALALGGELINETGSMFENALKYAGGVNKDSLTFAESALEDIASSNSENLQMLAGLSGGQAKQNAESLNAIMDLAKFKQDNGESENKQQQIILLVVIVIVLGLVAMMAVKR
ncbi:chemotaxis protein [Vibrio metoecus]|uniref:hypothetical protein n=1 Tax=Vibrio metoecus TaxID=1481663 RepID=UPI0006D7FC37|nr:hypothetical protein [Vibrio metoecus]KQB00769.1 chemotaxis protein [Vibrio metoecus]PAR55996.1 chemotaxis protein [Vibrio metoecus]PAR60725.1 chemotaxis protein [Vibrio metoecus]